MDFLQALEGPIIYCPSPELFDNPIPKATMNNLSYCKIQ